MARMGFQESPLTTGVFAHQQRNLRVVAHVDDFLVSGHEVDLDWFKGQLAQKYEVKSETIGWELADPKEMSFLLSLIHI